MIGRLHTPTANVAEYIQHALAFNQTVQLCTVFTVIVEPAGFLTVNHRRHKTGIVFYQRGTIVFQRALNHFHVLWQTFDRAQLAIVFQHDALWFGDFIDGINNGLTTQLHCHTGNLDHHHIAKTVNHQSRQTIAVTKHPAVTGLRIPQFTATLCYLQTMHNQRGIQRLFTVTTEQARTDQLFRTDHSNSQRFAVGGFDHNFSTGGHVFQWRNSDIHFIAVYPQVTAFQTAFSLGFESQCREHDSPLGPVTKRSALYACSDKLPQKAVLFLMTFVSLLRTCHASATVGRADTAHHAGD